jgi:hypothetical protein
VRGLFVAGFIERQPVRTASAARRILGALFVDGLNFE